MRRRDFIKVVACSAIIWPLAARAQQPNRVRRIGALLTYPESDPDAQSWVSAFRQELGKLGWAEGSNIHIDVRWATADVQSIESCAKELVALQPDFILTSSTPATAAMVQQTRAIPIIFVMVGDPVGSGFVESLSRPGGNLTGLTPIESSLGGKWMELLKEITPTVTRAAMLFNPPTASFAAYYLNPFKVAARSFGVEAIVAPVQDKSELESVVATQARQPNSGLIVMPDGRSIPSLRTPLSTLRLPPHDRTRMTRGWSGSLRLHRNGRAPSTFRRSPATNITARRGYSSCDGNLKRNSHYKICSSCDNKLQ